MIMALLQACCAFVKPLSYNDRMAKSKIAIIEDDLAIIQMYRMKFTSEGYDVATAENGVEGLKLIEEFKPDIVLLDLMMPVMTGSDMLTELRQKPWGKDARVIILTNMGENEAPESTKNAGIEGFIVKAEMTPKQVADYVTKTLAK